MSRYIKRFWLISLRNIWLSISIPKYSSINEFLPIIPTCLRDGTVPRYNIFIDWMCGVHNVCTRSHTNYIFWESHKRLVVGCVYIAARTRTNSRPVRSPLLLFGRVHHSAMFLITNAFFFLSSGVLIFYIIRLIWHFSFIVVSRSINTAWADAKSVSGSFTYTSN